VIIEEVSGYQLAALSALHLHTVLNHLVDVFDGKHRLSLLRVSLRLARTAVWCQIRGHITTGSPGERSFHFRLVVASDQRTLGASLQKLVYLGRVHLVVRRGPSLALDPTIDIHTILLHAVLEITFLLLRKHAFASLLVLTIIQI
jgi:hypothetical protein